MLLKSSKLNFETQFFSCLLKNIFHGSTQKYAAKIFAMLH